MMRPIRVLSLFGALAAIALLAPAAETQDRADTDNAPRVYQAGGGGGGIVVERPPCGAARQTGDSPPQAGTVLPDGSRYYTTGREANPVGPYDYGYLWAYFPPFYGGYPHCWPLMYFGYYGPWGARHYEHGHAPSHHGHGPGHSGRGRR